MNVAVNHLPVLTWNSNKLNNAVLDINGFAVNGKDETISGFIMADRHKGSGADYLIRAALPMGIDCSRNVSSKKLYEMFDKLGINNPAEAIVAGKKPIYNRQSFGTGMGDGIDELMKDTGCDVYTVSSEYEEVKAVKLNYVYPENEGGLSRIFIHAKEGSESTFILYFSKKPKACDFLQECGRCTEQQELLSAENSMAGSQKKPGSHADQDAGSGESITESLIAGNQTYLYLEEGARVHIHVVQMLDKEVTFFNDLGIYQAESSVLTMTKLDLGAGKVYEGLNNLQAGDRSDFSMDFGYLGLKDYDIDINYNDVFLGKKAMGRMYFKEALLDNAKKTFRGTLDFRQYSTASKGDEQEDVILLGDEVVNKTIPLILCEEEDVDGRHAATIGSLPEDMLFYMQTRGISKKKAQEIMVRSQLNYISSLIPSESIQKAVKNAICRVFE